MSNSTEDLEQLKHGIAYLAASIVQALADVNSDFKDQFDKTLDKAYRTLREQGSDSLAGLEIMRWTGEILKRRID